MKQIIAILILAILIGLFALYMVGGNTPFSIDLSKPTYQLPAQLPSSSSGASTSTASSSRTDQDDDTNKYPKAPAGTGMHPSWDADNDGINDCENDGTCDHTVDYSQPRKTTSPVAPADYVGLSVAEAKALAAANGVPFRVVFRDGEHLPVTMDFVVGRVNAAVQNNVVVGYSVEGENH